MNDTQETTKEATDIPSGGGRWRRVIDTERSRTDGVLGGVSAGLARRLDIDPVIVRVAFVVLTLAGGAGIILYAAAWFVLPADDADKSVAAEWFRLDKNEEQVRVAALVGAGVLSIVAIVGDGGWGWDGWPWALAPVALLYYVFAVRPRRRRAEREAYRAATSADPQLPRAERVRAARLATSREHRSSALTVLTMSIAAIIVAATRIWAEIADRDVEWPVYLAVALGVVAAGLLVGTVVGHGGPLIGLGVVLAVVLAVGSVLPSPRTGQQDVQPTSASVLEPRYEHGIGQLDLDLTQVADPDGLLGRTVILESGIGQTRVFVPEGLNVEVGTKVRAGQVEVFDQRADGTDTRLDVPADPGPFLTIEIVHGLGSVEVFRR